MDDCPKDLTIITPLYSCTICFCVAEAPHAKGWSKDKDSVCFFKNKCLKKRYNYDPTFRSAQDAVWDSGQLVHGDQEG